jgi:hypothetical protein
MLAMPVTNAKFAAFHPRMAGLATTATQEAFPAISFHVTGVEDHALIHH